MSSEEAGEGVELFVEMACNTLFGAGKDGFINAPDPHRVFTVRACGPVVKVNGGCVVNHNLW